MSYWEHAKPVQRRRAVDAAALADAAVRLLDAGGLRALTVRAVAAELGVTPASLYSRVRGIDDLFDLALDAALGADVDDLQARPGEDFMQLMGEYYRHLVAHPWAVQVLAARAPRGPHYLALSERMVRLLEARGVHDPLATAYTVSNFVIGSATTASMASAEVATPIPREQAPRYAALHAVQNLDPEHLMHAGLRALLAAGRVPAADPGPEG
ncbi:TetR family transcriptional regulator [Leucobacter chromiireducens]|uniref:TetR family transcriptional regulator n=1 Tax=Leucobacter chromiireducens subsp. solipictus TaxID=398235 RepID=A0ABS1SFM8_9MICO|nr:TetR family transcriptional regulator [Leucobacter chromiireducens subsp. solipictus]